MAGTTVLTDTTGMLGSDVLQVRLEHNRLVDDVEALRAAFATLVTKLNADAGVTDTNYASVLAATLTAAKVADVNGNTTL
jgi:hypothetical protein